MIKNFDSVKQQLKELAEIVNSYKSEAVQLRLVELVLGGQRRDAQADDPGTVVTSRKPRRGSRRRRSPGKPEGTAEGTAAPKQRGSRPSGRKLGAVAAFTRLYNEGFFKTTRMIGDVVREADEKLATKIKTSDISGLLARYSRDRKLDRKKNADGQYEYTQI